MDLLGAYVLDALYPAEKAAVEAYLPGSPACLEEVRILRRGASAYALAAEERDPSPELRTRLWEAIQAESRGGAGSAGGLQASAEPATPVIPFPTKPASSAPETGTPGTVRSFPVWGRLAAALALVLIGALLTWAIALRGDDDTTEPLVLGQFSLTDAADPSLATGGDVSYIEDENIMRLDLHDLPDLNEGEVFQLWVVTDDGTVLPSVVFGKGTDTVTSVAMVANPVGVDALALTREPGPIGSVSATTPIFAIADIDTSDVETQG